VRSIVRAQLGQDVFHVPFDGLFHDPKLASDHFVGIACGNSAQNLDLALRERVAVYVPKISFAISAGTRR